MRLLRTLALFVAGLAGVIYVLSILASLVFGSIAIGMTYAAFWHPEFFRTRTAVDVVLIGWLAVAAAAVLQGVLGSFVLRR